MKKLVFGLIATIAFSFSGFANDCVQIIKDKNCLNNAKVESKLETVEFNKTFGTCTYTLVFTTVWSDGTVTQTRRTYTVEASSQEDCDKKANQHASIF